MERRMELPASDCLCLVFCILRVLANGPPPPAAQAPRTPATTAAGSGASAPPRGGGGLSQASLSSPPARSAASRREAPGAASLQHAERWVASVAPTPIEGEMVYPGIAALDPTALASQMPPLFRPAPSAAQRAALVAAVESGEFVRDALRIFRSFDQEQLGSLTWAGTEVYRYASAALDGFDVRLLPESSLYPLLKHFGAGTHLRLEALQCLCLADAVARLGLRSCEAEAPADSAASAAAAAPPRAEASAAEAAREDWTTSASPVASARARTGNVYAARTFEAPAASGEGEELGAAENGAESGAPRDGREAASSHPTAMAEAWVTDYCALPMAGTVSISYSSGVVVDFRELARALLPVAVANLDHRERLVSAIERGEILKSALAVYKATDDRGFLAWANGELFRYVLDVFRHYGLAAPDTDHVRIFYDTFDIDRKGNLNTSECLCLVDALCRAIFHIDPRELDPRELQAQKASSSFSDAPMPARSSGDSAPATPTAPKVAAPPATATATLTVSADADAAARSLFDEKLRELNGSIEELYGLHHLLNVETAQEQQVVHSKIAEIRAVIDRLVASPISGGGSNDRRAKTLPASALTASVAAVAVNRRSSDGVDEDSDADCDAGPSPPLSSPLPAAAATAATVATSATAVDVREASAVTFGSCKSSGSSPATSAAASGSAVSAEAGAGASVAADIASATNVHGAGAGKAPAQAQASPCYFAIATDAGAAEVGGPQELPPQLPLPPQRGSMQLPLAPARPAPEQPVPPGLPPQLAQAQPRRLSAGSAWDEVSQHGVKRTSLNVPVGADMPMSMCAMKSLSDWYNSDAGNVRVAAKILVPELPTTLQTHSENSECSSEDASPQPLVHSFRMSLTEVSEDSAIQEVSMKHRPTLSDWFGYPRRESADSTVVVDLGHEDSTEGQKTSVFDMSPSTRSTVRRSTRRTTVEVEDSDGVAFDSDEESENLALASGPSAAATVPVDTSGSSRSVAQASTSSGPRKPVDTMAPIG
eukprot:TRINITY_DN24088_c0_g1_i1.p1 TRINITY_DN24088_c0_g1~~TRINITY_DN24088_c0_g1_i1.p1  ORF type:complete len:1143 (-),score=316.55 TRINITY_DN24088_c0_g1_i1:65-3073(-)